MALSRRQFLIGAGLAAAATTTGLAGCAPGSGGGGSQGSGGAVELSLAFWGNPTRNKNTQAEIDAYVKANPNVKITGQPGDFASYWDKLATQTAGGTAPDIIQMDMAYISEYGNRGALLDLAKYGVDVSKFVDGHGRFGQDQRHPGRGQRRHQRPGVLRQPGGLREGQGVDARRHDVDLGPDVGGGAPRWPRRPGFRSASSRLFGSDQLFGAFLRQNGKELFVDKGLGFETADAQAWYDLMVKFQKAGGIGSPQQISEEQRQLGQVAGPERDRASGTPACSSTTPISWRRPMPRPKTSLKMLRFPSLTGKATDRKTWYKASMLWSASSKTKNPEAAAAFINWWVNSTDAAGIDLAERGIPANSELQAFVKPKLSPAQQSVAKFITDIKPELGPTPIAPPPGGGKLADVLFRYGTRCAVRHGEHGGRRAEVRGRDEVEPTGLMS